MRRRREMRWMGYEQEEEEEEGKGDDEGEFAVPLGNLSNWQSRCMLTLVSNAPSDPGRYGGRGAPAGGARAPKHRQW